MLKHKVLINEEEVFVSPDTFAIMMAIKSLEEALASGCSAIDDRLFSIKISLDSLEA